MSAKLAIALFLAATTMSSSQVSAREVYNSINDGGDGNAHEVCAMRFSEFDLTRRLQQLKPLFPANSVSGYVNQTGGSYYEIDSRGEWLRITFMTSGLFDLYLIRRSSAVVICDDGEKLTVKGLDREDKMMIDDGKLIMGKGGPKQTFSPGPMPDLLKNLSEEKP